MQIVKDYNDLLSHFSGRIKRIDKSIYTEQ